MSEHCFHRIFKRRLLPAAGLESADLAVPAAQALLSGGLDVMEVPFRNAEAPRCVERIRNEVPGMQIGAGTLIHPRQVREAIDAGAEFGVTPGFNPAVIEEALKRNFPLIPGVLTPGEMEQAMVMGCFTVKFFPAAEAGGVSFLKALAGPYGPAGLRVIPFGGINPTNLSQYLALPLVPAVGGSWIVSRELTSAHAWDEIERQAREALELAQTFDACPTTSRLKA
jgi:2-dehydro-3-deoxyphosphogluconate aldolase/(4S)-4-hydroxy-2-oxoglutarate aldolase